MIMIIMMIKTKQQKNAKKINKMYLFILIYIYTRELLQIYIYIMYKEQKNSRMEFDFIIMQTENSLNISDSGESNIKHKLRASKQELNI